ncbi:FAD-dependent oxidoreductase [Streptomyces thinghirensis]|nr:FAD-dependent oxidoreductase [Streptomyces thinghirensis]
MTAEMGAMRFPPSSTALQHYIDLVGLETRSFPNPLAEATPSTVRRPGGESHYAETLDDLPQVYRDVADAWAKCLEEGADFSDMNRALRGATSRASARSGRSWSKFDNQTFYGFLCDSEAFKSFRHREIFGQVGRHRRRDTDFPTPSWRSSASSTPRPTTTIMHRRRLPATAAAALGARTGEDRPLAPRHLAEDPCTWTGDPRPSGATRPHPHRRQPHHRDRRRRRHPHLPGGDLHRPVRDAAVEDRLRRLAVPDRPLDGDRAQPTTWSPASSSKPADRPFWLDKDEVTGRDVMSMTLTDRMTRGTYLLDDGPDKPAVICLSYTWCDDSLEVSPAVRERADGGHAQVARQRSTRRSTSGKHIIGKPA